LPFLFQTFDSTHFSWSWYNSLQFFLFGFVGNWCAEYFQNKLVDTIHFMEILSLKDSVEKDTFFRKLPNLAEQLPRQIVLKKVCLSGSFNTLNLWFYQQSIPIDYVFNFWFSVTSFISFCPWIWFSCCPCFDCIVENGFLAFSWGVPCQGK